MAFPVPTVTLSDGTTTPFVVTLSANTSGQLMMIVVLCEQNIEPNIPTGWTRFIFGNSNPVTAVYYKFSTGGEASVDFTLSANKTWTAWAASFSGAHASSVPQGTGIDNDQNPPNLAPGWGSQDILWFALCNKYQFAITTTPTNYSLYVWAGTSDQIRYDLRGRELNASSEDPSTYNVAGDNFVATFAVRPALITDGYVFPPRGKGASW